MGTIKMTTAQALVTFLNNQYINVDGVEKKFVKGIFAIFGHGNVLGLGQALEQNSGDLIIYQGRNEQGMAHAAIGFAKQSLRRQIIACSSSVGPGAANMLTAAATATTNRIPLLLLPGDIFTTRQPDPVLQQIEQSYDLNVSTNDAFRAVSKYWDRVSRPEQLMTACINALRVLTDPAETGAVTIALPQDVQGEAWNFPDYFFHKRVHRLDRRLPTVVQLEDALMLISRKRNPMIVMGGGVKYSEAGEVLRQFAEHYQIPFAETQAGKGTIVSDHPLNVGGVGETGSLAANLLAKQADLVIGIGTRYTDFTTASKWIFQNPDVNFLNVNVSNFDSYKLDGIQLLADAREALIALDARLAAKNYSNDWGNQIEQAQNKLLKEIQRIHQVEYTGEEFIPEIADHLDYNSVFAEFKTLTQSVLTQSRVLGILNNHLPQDAVIVAAAGSLPGDLQRIWRTRDYNSYHVEYGYSCMGYEVNAALGVKLAQPQREVYALVGDGSFMMLHSELITSIQEHTKINVVLFDNMTNGCINNLQMEHGMDSFITEFRFRNSESGKLEGGFIPVDFASIAKGYGCKSYRVTTLEQLLAALDDVQKQTISTLIDIKVLPKTMVHKYCSWWHVGVAQTSKSKRIQAMAEQLNKHVDEARKY
ncbi:3D-(3,5/4)-trihydroxycyclohexane-1,2-dione acylhydrolase (decyclizing) [Pantoea sp. Nvir]|uniref:3D-(3,5/4)-trihydroxycyclohexane-1,2-dione acylhydrolase (decyclizing) n=1 Tax=Pantoea sp. Nvir TaxID=2576760 RepID=UPI0027FCAC3C|nr:3D-(3,5/4)-trihydroxycyclohexane-1,2-dione acylhydrolase (decyclizing) [Pantoea sp. Nvir]CAJ0992449.1 3D-(3,5/4)-trihydroxycyclohexane-1,2-dione hydrolase [Pantoea sp. Nvir]